MIKILDAVMGTGKSTYMFKFLNDNPTVPMIILVPLISEVIRYEQEISSDFNGKVSNIVALHSGRSKTERFLKAIDKDQSVITTHQLFAQLNSTDIFKIRNKIDKYLLVIDETITLVEEKFIPSADIEALETEGYIRVSDHPTVADLKQYELLQKGIDYLESDGQDHRRTLETVSGKHLYRVNGHNVVFVVPPEMLTSFGETIVLTYLFDGSETNAWLEVFSIPFEHLEFSRNPQGDIQADPHPLTYSGSSFANKLHIYDYPINNIGNRRRGQGRPLTKSWYGTSSRARTRDLNQLRNHTRTFFRRMGATRAEMLWTTFKDYRERVRDSDFDPKRGPLETWLPQNERATNEYSDRKYLAFLVDVYAPVGISAFFSRHNVRFDQDNFALSRVLQWIWRSAIRNKEDITVYLPSARMRDLVKRWLR